MLTSAGHTSLIWVSQRKSMFSSSYNSLSTALAPTVCILSAASPRSPGSPQLTSLMSTISSTILSMGYLLLKMAYSTLMVPLIKVAVWTSRTRGTHLIFSLRTTVLSRLLCTIMIMIMEIKWPLTSLVISSDARASIATCSSLSLVSGMLPQSQGRATLHPSQESCKLYNPQTTCLWRSLTLSVAPTLPC